LLKDDEKTDTNKPRPEHELPLRLRNSAIHRKYSLKEVISSDFAGILYATAKRSGGKAIAVKVLNEGYALVSNSVGNIEHSRICQILHTIIERETIQAVVLEKPDGAPLSSMIREQGALEPGQVVSAGLQLLSALHAVHWNDASVGNLHSDSIFLSRDRQGNLDLQLTNLGIGCIQDKLRETDYLAPEQIMGGKSGGKTADIWAAGVILYEMLVGIRPFRGENRYAVAGEILLH
jgi:eukaryotic-like serine/threonine-protein kinase